VLSPSKTNFMRQRKFIPVTQFSGIQQKAIAVTGADLTDLDLNVMDDDSAAVAGTQVHLALERGVTEQGMLWSEMESKAAVNVLTDSGALGLPVLHRPIDEMTFTVKHDADPTSNQNATELYVVPTGPPNEFGVQEGVLYSVCNANADSELDEDGDTDAWVVHDNDNAATIEIQGTALSIKFDDDGADTENRLVVDNPTGCDIYVMSKQGRPLKIFHDTTLAGSEPVVEYADAGAAGSQLYFVDPGTTNSSCTSGTQDGWRDLKGWYLFPLYVDDDGATESERFMAAISAGIDAQVFFLSGNRMITVVYDADPATNFDASLVYIDDNEADMTEAFTSVCHGDADCTVQLDPVNQVYDDEAGNLVGTVSADTVLVSAADNTAIIEEVNGTGIMGLKMAAADVVSHLMLLPGDVDRHNPVYVRMIYTTGSATTGDGVTWVFTYEPVTPDDTAITGTINDALDTTIVEDFVTGQWDIQRTAAGVINGKTIADAALYMLMKIEMDATDASEDIFLLGAELEYSPKQGRQDNGMTPEAPEWKA